MRKYITDFVWLTAIVGLIVYDIWAFVDGIPDNTLSARILFYTFTEEHFTLAFMVGALMGHLFWPRKNPIFNLKRLTAVLILAGLSIVVALIDISGWLNGQVILPWALPAGYPLGHWLWPQAPFRKNR